MSTAPTPLLQIDNLVVEFSTRNGIVRVLDNISLSLAKGETLGIVGESGCGKSMTALSVMGLVPKPAGNITNGSIKLNDTELVGLAESDLRQIRGKDISMIFQEPMTSLNPLFTAGNQIAEALLLHENITKKQAADKAVQLLELVGIPEPLVRAGNYPHQLSGGMRQRVMIAIALACNPGVLIADEPTTALDVTVQAQIFDLLQDLQEKTETAIILITHDMGAIAEMADRVVVMYAGRVVEEGKVGDILQNPRHPYTRGLIACVPHLEEKVTNERKRLEEIPGVVPPLSDLGKPGCAFAPRCAFADAQCNTTPELRQVTPHQQVRCWHVGEGGRVS